MSSWPSKSLIISNSLTLTSPMEMDLTLNRVVKKLKIFEITEMTKMQTFVAGRIQKDIYTEIRIKLAKTKISHTTCKKFK